MSRLSRQKLSLDEGETTCASFTLDMNLSGDVFLLGFTLTPEVETPGEWLYYNPRIKKIVMRDDQRSVGVAYLNPRAQVLQDPSLECRTLAGDV
jgi:hypothetical protein